MARGQPLKNTKLGAGCLTLFALPFFAVGVGMTWWCARIALEHSAMQSWVETPAVMKHAELKANRGGEGTTYATIATYDYQFAGRPFTGQRVGIDSGGDDIGSFQRDAFNELKRHLDQKKPFRCFVNPERPNEAVLYRSLRGDVLVFKTLFASVFGAIGLGLMTAVITAARRAPATRTDVPIDAPWASRADWESGLLETSTRSQAVIATVSAVALYWWISILPLVWKLPAIMAQSRGIWKGAAFVFPLIGVVLVTALAYLMVRGRKFGESTLHLASTPGVIGGQLAGVVRTHKPVAATEGFRITLDCLDWVSDGDGRVEKSIWQDEQLVMEPMRGNGEGTAIPVLFAIPFDLRETTRPGEKGDIHWRLAISAKMPGVDYGASFDVPVFKTAESRPDFKLDEALVAQVAPAPDHDLVLREAGIIRQPFGNGVRLVFRMTRNMSAAIGITVVSSIIWLIIWGVLMKESMLMTIFFGGFGLVTAFIAIDLWFYRSAVEASPTGLALRGGLFGIGRRHIVPVEDIQDFMLKEGMSSGATVWHNILVVLRSGKKRTVARSVKGKLAQRVVLDELKAALHLVPGTDAVI